jgi:ornithine cyclodeaminase
VGKLAEDQLAAICSVRPIRAVHVYNRTSEKAVAFCKTISARYDVEAISQSRPEEVAQNADIVITATSSFSPVLFQEWLVRPCLVIAVGANHWYRREIDAKVFGAAKMIVADGIETAKTEGGALLYAVSQGHCMWSQVEELGRIVAGRTKLPEFGAGTILFSHHGLTLTDVALSAMLYKLALERGIGKEIDLDSGRLLRD